MMAKVISINKALVVSLSDRCLLSNIAVGVHINQDFLGVCKMVTLGELVNR